MNHCMRLVIATWLALAMTSTGHASETDAFDMQRCVNMGNSFDSPRDAPWGKPIDPSDFKTIRSKGFDTVRIPVRWSDYTSDKAPFRIEAHFLEHVEKIVNAALAEDLNVILNVHHFEEIMEDPLGQTDKLIAIWDQLAPAFQNKSNDLWFEVLNEPFNELKGDLMRSAQARAIKAIRKTNPARPIILGGEDWSNIRTLESNLWLPDPNIIYTFHYYDPFSFTHQKAPWLGDSMPKKKRGWGKRKDHKELESAVKTATEFRKAMARPIFLGEFGAYENIKNSERVEYVSAVRKAMESAQIPWCLWSFSNTFALYDNDKLQWDEKMLKALLD